MQIRPMKFHLGDILSIVGEEPPLVSPRKIRGVFDLLNYMTRGGLNGAKRGNKFNAGLLLDAATKCAPYLVKQYPGLSSVDYSSVNESNWKRWLDKQIAKHGEYLEVKPLPIGAYKTPNEARGRIQIRLT